MWSPEHLDFSKNTGTTFLLASWHELFHAYTPDSNQPRLHNVPSLVDELGDIGARLSTEPRFQRHLEMLQEELARALKDEDAILLRVPEYRSRAHYLVTEKSPVGVFTGCKVLAEQKERYHEILIHTAREAVDQLPKQKESAHQGIRRLATVAFQHGKEDNDVWEPLDKDTSRAPADVLTDIVSLSTEQLKKYQCTIAVTGEPSQIQSTLRMAGFSPVSASSLPTYYLNELGVSAPHEQRFSFVESAIEATSIRNAVAFSRKRLGIAEGLVSLYCNSQLLHVHPTALVKAEGLGVVFSQSEQAFRRLYPRSRPTQDIREGLHLLQSDSVDERLLGAIELLSMASSSSDSRVRLTNLWSSVETLSGGHEAKTTLDRVSALLVPLIISRHVSRTIRYLSIETQDLGSRLGTINYGAGFVHSNEKFVSPRDMLKTLASPKNSPPICDLLRFAEHPLLRHRLYCVWKIFQDPKQLHLALTHSSERLKWHIARIYRARNLLVHQGEESQFLVPLLDNLQNYISMAVQRVVHELKKHPKWDVRCATEYWNGKMIHMFRCLKTDPSLLTVADFIEDQPADLIWPH